MFCRNPLPFLLSCLFLACATVHRAPSTPTLYDTDTQPPRTNKNQKKKLSAAARKKKRLRKLLWQIGVPIASAAVVALIGRVIIKRMRTKKRESAADLLALRYTNGALLQTALVSIEHSILFSTDEKLRELEQHREAIILHKNQVSEKSKFALIQAEGKVQELLHLNEIANIINSDKEVLEKIRMLNALDLKITTILNGLFDSTPTQECCRELIWIYNNSPINSHPQKANIIFSQKRSSLLQQLNLEKVYY